jgi:hypothetical protein
MSKSIRHSSIIYDITISFVFFRYMTDPEAYKLKHHPSQKQKDTPPKKDKKTKMELLVDESQEIQRAAFIHTKWVMTVDKQYAGKCNDGKVLERILGVLGKDQQWMQKTAVFFLFPVLLDMLCSLIGISKECRRRSFIIDW